MTFTYDRWYNGDAHIADYDSLDRAAAVSELGEESVAAAETIIRNHPKTTVKITDTTGHEGDFEIWIEQDEGANE